MEGSVDLLALAKAGGAVFAAPAPTRGAQTDLARTLTGRGTVHACAAKADEALLHDVAVPLTAHTGPGPAGGP
jgi:hypothetical protein